MEYVMHLTCDGRHLHEVVRASGNDRETVINLVQANWWPLQVSMVTAVYV